MHAAVFAGWIRQLSERAFDGTFLELLRAQGFYDIHFSHGGFEFGKDFIAKRNEPTPVQYAFQSKAGDIGGAEWQRIRGQLEELADREPAHPNFDTAVPLKAVLVVTGRLVGKATVAPTAFKNRLESSGRGTFEVWDEHTLAELLAGSSRFPQALATEAEAILVGVESASMSLRDIESRLAPGASEAEAPARRALVDSSVAASLLADRGRPFLALGALLAGVRSAATAAHGNAGLGKDLIRTALDLYVAYGQRLLCPLIDAPDDVLSWSKWVGGGPVRTLTFSVAVSGVIEFLGLAALHLEQVGRSLEAQQLAMACARVVESVPAASHPVSDRHAASIVPAAAALSVFGHEAALARWIRRTLNWLCDRYDTGQFGLAGVYATPTQEARHLLGQPFEAIELTRRNDSLIAVALADVAHVLAPSEFERVINDLRAVGVVPSALHAKDEPNAYRISFGGTVALINIAYPDRPTSPLPHHALQEQPRTPERLGGAAVPLALASLLRDRLFTDVLPRLKTAPRV